MEGIVLKETGGGVVDLMVACEDEGEVVGLSLTLLIAEVISGASSARITLPACRRNFGATPPTEGTFTFRVTYGVKNTDRSCSNQCCRRYLQDNTDYHRGGTRILFRRYEST